jgi:uncharacterized protein (DUF1330 family)
MNLRSEPAAAVARGVGDDVVQLVSGDERGGNMSVYFVLMQQIDNIDRYRSEYVSRVMPFLEKHGGEVVAAGFEAEAAEGEPPNSTVVLRFPDTGAAWGFLDDPGYQPLKELRYSITSRGQAVVVPAFTPAG